MVNEDIYVLLSTRVLSIPPDSEEDCCMISFGTVYNRIKHGDASIAPWHLQEKLSDLMLDIRSMEHLILWEIQV